MASPEQTEYDAVNSESLTNENEFHQNSSITSSEIHGNGLWETAENQRKSDETGIASHSKTNRKEKIQTVVDLFNSLDSVDKATFFHCILPHMQNEDLENLKFSISLDRNVDPSKDTTKIAKESEKQETPRRSTKKKKKALVQDKKLSGDEEENDVDDKHVSVKKVQEPMQTRSRKRILVDEPKDPKPSTKKKSSKQNSKPNKRSKRTKDDNVEDVEMEEVPKGPTLRKHTNISFAEEDPSDVDVDPSDDVNDDDYDPHEDEPLTVKASTPKRSKSSVKYLKNDTAEKSKEDDTTEINSMEKSEPEIDAEDDQDIEEDFDVDKVPAHVIRRLPKRQVDVQHKVLADSVCPACGLYKRSQEALAVHYAVKHMEKKFECKICKLKFLSEATLIGHEVIHSGEKINLQCSICNEEFNTFYELKYHQHKHLVTKSFSCPVCSRTFHHIRSLQKHIECHSQDVDQLEKESVKFVLENTQESNSGDSSAYVAKLVKGVDDGETASSLTISTLKSPVYDYMCDLCGACLKTRMALLKHQKTAHKDTGKRPHVCSYCGKAFLDKAGLINHERTHTGEKPFVCEICDKAFAQRSQLSTHRKRVHFKDLIKHKVMCDVCSKTFPHTYGLKRHYVIHTGEKNYPCKYCERKFARPKDLDSHERTHTGEKPFVCQTCGKAFADRSNLKVHEKIHTDGDECPTCLRRFRNVREFRKHRKNCTPEVAILPKPQEPANIIVHDYESMNKPHETADDYHETNIRTMHTVNENYEARNKSYVTTVSAATVQEHDPANNSTIVHSMDHLANIGNVEFVNESGEPLNHQNVEFVNENGEPLNQQAVSSILNLSVGQNYYY